MRKLGQILLILPTQRVSRIELVLGVVGGVRALVSFPDPFLKIRHHQIDRF